MSGKIIDATENKNFVQGRNGIQKEYVKIYGHPSEFVGKWVKSSEKGTAENNPRFTVIPVKNNKEGDSPGQSHSKNISKIRLESCGEIEPFILQSNIRPKSKNRLKSEGDREDQINRKFIKSKSRIKSEGDKVDQGQLGPNLNPKIHVVSMSSLSSSTSEDSTKSTEVCGYETVTACHQLSKHYHTFNGNPRLLAPFVRPKEVRSASNLSVLTFSPLSHHFRQLGNLPHGATIPPLHETNTLHGIMLDNLLKESERNIEFGTTDGKNLKVYTRKTSMQLLDEGTRVNEPFTASRGERFPRFSGVPDYDLRDRPIWKSKIEFILACIGSCVGLGSFWRLPYLCLLYGRAAFLVPYFVIFFIGGVPLLLAELAIGQFTQLGPIGAFRNICPMMQGVGIGLVALSLFISVYYSLIFSESILSLGLILGEPHVFCNTSRLLFCSNQAMASITGRNLSLGDSVLEESMTLMDHINPKTEAMITLLVTLIVSWMLVYFALWKSVRSIGKISKVSATVPFLLIFVFVWRALTLPGATSGLQYFFDPQWSVLRSGKVWVNAGVQVLISLNVVFGCTVTFSSYNRQWNNVNTDVHVISFVSCASSLLAIVIVFSGIGNIVHETGHVIEDINFAEADLAFVVYPRILFKMPQKHLWSAVFFLLLLLLGLDSQFSSVEVIVTSLSDKIKKSNRELCFRPLTNLIQKHEFLVLCVCVVCFIASLPFVLQGHEFFPHLNHFDAMNLALLALTICEAGTFFWLYGTTRLQRCIQNMTSKKPNVYYFYCWRIFTPLSFIALLLMAVVAYELPSFDKAKSSTYKMSIDILSCVLALLSVAPVPFCAVWSLWRAKAGSLRERLIKVLTPQINVKIPTPNCKDKKKSVMTWLRLFSPSFRNLNKK